MERTVRWMNPPADRTLIDQMDAQLPHGSIKHDPRPEKWLTTFIGVDEAEIIDLMARHAVAYTEIMKTTPKYD